MVRGIAMTEREAYLQLDSSQKFNLSNVWLTFVPTAFIGICFGTAILLVGGLSNKWVFVLILAGSFPIFVVAIGSLERALQTLLIFSLFTTMNWNPWWSDSYRILKPGMPIDLTSIILLALYILWLCSIYSRSASVRFFPSVTIPFAVIVLWSGLSFLVATEPAYVVNVFPLALTAFLLFIYAANHLKSQEDIRFVITCVAIAVAFCGILGICQHVAGTSFNLMFLGGAEDQRGIEYLDVSLSRVSALFNEPNNFAHLLSGVLPLLFVCALGITGFGLRILCTVSFFLGSMSLVLTFSRGGWLALVTSLLFITIVSLKRQWRKNFRGFLVRLIVIGSAAVVLMAPFFSGIVTRLTKHDYGSAYSRIPLALTALEIIKREPLTGVGLGNYRVAVPYYDSNALAGRRGDPVTVHTMYLYIAAELGVPALGIFLWISILFFRQGIIALTSADRQRSLFALGMLTGLAGIYLYGIFEDICFGDPRFLLVSAIGGFLMALKYPIKAG